MIWALSIATQCGDNDDSSHPAPSGGAGGLTNDAAPSGYDSSVNGVGDGGTAGVSAVSAEDACRSWVEATCTRSGECQDPPGPPFESCLRASEQCPGYLFASGSTRIPDEVPACAASLAAVSCEDWRANRLPSCATPGTRGDGESCHYSSQCQSRNCVAMVCAPFVPSDGS